LSSAEPTARPGAWLRLTSLASVVAMAAVVASGQLGLAHRALALVVLPLLAALAVAAWFAHRRLVPTVTGSTLLFLGALATWWYPPLHLALSTAALAASALLAAAAYRGPIGRFTLAPWRDYVTLTKPRIMSLLLVTGFCGMAAAGLPSLWVSIAAMLGLALACGGASALNHYLDRDIDKLMGSRTRARPVAAGRIAPAHALEFGVALSAVSFVLLASAVNVLTALLALVGNLFYVLIYTGLLKRSTPQNIVIGGAAGAVPPLVGWAAATGSLGLPALALFLIVFLWTPPHFWALALLIKDDYANAKVPMLPNVRGERETTRQILLYTLVMIAFTVAAGVWLGWFYAATALALGGVFLWLAWQLRRDTTPRRAAVLFHYSLAYLALLFVAAALDPVVL
jgi:protoheme IX farnesyltransferase